MLRIAEALRFRAGLGALLLLLGAQALAAPFVPETFPVPEQVKAEGFVLVPLGPKVLEVDFEAYMSSIDHLQRTFTHSQNWPRADLTAEDAVADMAQEAALFESRRAFAYAVLTPDGTQERGCIYVRPSLKAGYDAVVRLWVTEREFKAGFDGELEKWTRGWIEKEWPFKAVAWPDRGIPWAEWQALPKAP